MALHPRGETTVAVSNRDDLLCIVNSGFNFLRFRMMDVSLSRSTSLSVKAATVSTSKFLNAILKPSRFFKTISHERPAKNFKRKALNKIDHQAGNRILSW